MKSPYCQFILYIYKIFVNASLASIVVIDGSMEKSSKIYKLYQKRKIRNSLFLFYIIIITCSGYMAPEYAMRGFLSVKTDVFSYGILVLEIVSGRKNHDTQLTGEKLDLLSYVSCFWEISASTLKNFT